MSLSSHRRWIVLVVANVLFCCVLGFYRTTTAAPRKSAEPFANSVQQRAEVIAQLKAINALLKQQNSLLASGKLKVVATIEEEDPR